MNNNNFNEDYAIKIFGTLYSKVADGHLAFAELIYDDTYPNGTNLGDNSQYSINRLIKKDIDAINDPNKDWTINNLRINGQSHVTSPIKIWKDSDDGDYEYIDLSTDGYTFFSSDDPSNYEHHYWSEIASKKYVDNRVNALINGAPDAYDTLKEISDYIISDKDAGAAILNKITNINNSIESIDSKYYDKNTIDTKINKVIAGDIDLTEYALKTDLSNYSLKTDLAKYALKTDLSNYSLKTDLAKYALKTDIPTVPTKTSQLTNDSGYITLAEDVNTTNKSLKFDSNANSDNMNLSLTVTDSDNKSISDDIKFEKANSETAGLMSAVDRNLITFLLNKINELESRVNKLSTSGDTPQTENVDISEIPYIAIYAIRLNQKNIKGIFSGTGYTAFPTKTNPTILSAIAYKNNSSFNTETVATFPDLIINANELKVHKSENNNTSPVVGDTVEFDFTMGETRFTNCIGTIKEWTIRKIVDSNEYKTVLGTFTINNIKIFSLHEQHLSKPTAKNTNRLYYTVNGNSDYFVSQFETGKSYTITYTSSDVSKVNFKNTRIVNPDNASTSTGADEISVGNIGSTKDGTVVTPTINITSLTESELTFTITIPSDIYCINEIISIQYGGYNDVSLIYNY